MDLVDQSGEIRATAFKDQCDKFFDMVEKGKVRCVLNYLDTSEEALNKGQGAGDYVKEVFKYCPDALSSMMKN